VIAPPGPPDPPGPRPGHGVDGPVPILERAGQIGGPRLGGHGVLRAQRLEDPANRRGVAAVRPGATAQIDAEGHGQVLAGPGVVPGGELFPHPGEGAIAVLMGDPCAERVDDGPVTGRLLEWQKLGEIALLELTAVRNLLSLHLCVAPVVYEGVRQISDVVKEGHPQPHLPVGRERQARVEAAQALDSLAPHHDARGTDDVASVRGRVVDHQHLQLVKGLGQHARDRRPDVERR
jgi:hypothetical protein